MYSFPPADGRIILFDCFRPEEHSQCEEGRSLGGIHPEEDVVGDSLGVRVHQGLEDNPGEGGHAAGIPVVGGPPVAGSPGLAVVHHAAGDTLVAEQAHQDLAAVGLVAVELLAVVTSQRAVGTALVAVLALPAAVAVAAVALLAEPARWNLNSVAKGTVAAVAVGVSARLAGAVAAQEARHSEARH